MTLRRFALFASLSALTLACNEVSEEGVGGGSIVETACTDVSGSGAPGCTGSDTLCVWQGVRTEGGPDCPTCPGSDGTFWALEDVQPQSCGTGQIYGMEAFSGRVVVLSLLRSTCSFCQSQIQKMEEMALDLQASGVDVQFVVVNEAGPTFEANIEEFTSRSTMPIFQDVEALNIWRQLGGTKDDVYIYGSNGELITFQAIPDESINLTLAQEEGYANFRQLIVDAVEVDAGRAE